MEKTLHFLATYNTQIIQAGFAIVFLLIVIYVYRQFFMANMSETSSSQEGGVQTSALEQKLNILIEQQQKSRSQGGAGATPGRTEETANLAELDKLKTEIYNLRQQAAESEKLIDELRNKPSTNTDEAVAAQVAEVQKLAETKAEEMQATIKGLESRLAEYEIIADDIAELSQLRSDNAKLTQQLADIKANGGISTPSQEAPTAGAQAADAISAAPEAEEPKPEAKADEASDANESVSGLRLEDAQSLVDEAIAAASASTSDLSPASAADDISDVDRNLINEFEKTVLKKENE